MKLLIGLAALILVALSLAADYRWKRWVKAREAERERVPRP